MICFNCSTQISGRPFKCNECGVGLHKSCSIESLCDVCYITKGETSKVIEFEVPEHIRRSYIETYKKCPHKFLHEVIRDNPSPPNIYTQLGIDLHELFDKACNHLDYKSDEMHKDIDEIWDTYSDELFVGSATRESMYKRAHDSVDAFYKILPTLPVKPYATEETLFLSVGDDLPKVRITMDRIDLVDGELEISDWKTGKVMVGKKLSTDLQPPLYIKLVKEHYGMEVRKFKLYYLQEEKERIYTRSEHNPDEYHCYVGRRLYKINLTDAIREVQHIFSQITKGNFNIPQDTSKLYYECKMCHIREQGLCAGAEEQSWANNWRG